MKAQLFGATDGKDDRFVPGLELRFDVRIRFAVDTSAAPAWLLNDGVQPFGISRALGAE